MVSNYLCKETLLAIITGKKMRNFLVKDAYVLPKTCLCFEQKMLMFKVKHTHVPDKTCVCFL
jgi:hypothetical protein